VRLVAAHPYRLDHVRAICVPDAGLAATPGEVAETKLLARGRRTPAIRAVMSGCASRPRRWSGPGANVAGAAHEVVVKRCALIASAADTAGADGVAASCPAITCSS